MARAPLPGVAGRRALLAVFCCLVTAGSAGLVRFRPDMEYVYTFRSSTELTTVRRLQADSKIGFVLVRGLSASSGDQPEQQIYLRVHSATILADDYKRVLLSEERDFTKWFSFDISGAGTIDQVYYPRDEDEHVLAIKKGLASLLAGNLQVPQGDQVGQSSWSYNSNETGHEGQHQAAYTAAQSAPGQRIVFTKTRLTHPIPHGKSKHQKEIHYHPGKQLPTMIKILDEFEAPRETAPGFKYQGAESEDETELPEMKTYSEGQLDFVRQTHYPSPTGPPQDEDIVTDSLQVKQAPDKWVNFNLTSLKALIAGNLTCMRLAPMKGSNERSLCFEDLVETLLSVPSTEQLAEILTPFFKVPLSRHLSARKDRLNMLDAVVATHAQASQSLLTDLILLSPKPDAELVERLLTAAAGFKHTISEHYLETVEDIVFHPLNFPACMQEPGIQRVAVLVLGALAGHLWEAGYQQEAERIVAKIEDQLGVHDQWTYQERLKPLTKAEQEETHHDTVAWIEALGNAALQRSFPHIQSYTNASTTHHLLKRAGLHSMRDYQHDLAAGSLLKVALDENEDEKVRYEATLFYRDHPHGGFQNVTKFINPEEFVKANLSSEVAGSEVASAPSRRRVRRGFWEGIQFKLASPSIVWNKMLGSPKVGGEFGLTIRNELNMKIAPLEGHLRVDLLDEAYATALFGLIGQKIDVARARFCFNGHIGYNLNILKEFGVNRISDLAKAYDLVIRQVVGNIRRAVQIVVDLFNGELNVAQLFRDFMDKLEDIPSLIGGVRSASVDAVARLSQFDPDQLPPSFRTLVSVVQSAAQLFSDIKTDIMEFYQAVSEAISVTLPSAADKIWKSIMAIADSIPRLLSSPLKAIGDIFKGVLNIKMSVSSILSARTEIQEANFFNEGQRPYWFDLPTVIGDKLRELRAALAGVGRDFGNWVDEIRGSEDPIRKLTGGSLDSRTLRGRVQAEIESIFQDLMAPIEPIKDLLAPFLDIYNLVFDSVDAIKEAYQTLRTGYQKSLALIMKLFGPKAHQQFPRKFREPGGGVCSLGGFYPTNSAGHYKDQGVDLEMPPDTQLVAPFSGVIFKSRDVLDQVTLKARGGAFRNILVLINNVRPNQTITEDQGINVIAGMVIGTVQRSRGPCGQPNHIHLSMLRTKRNRLVELLDKALGDEEDALTQAAQEGYVDPTNYLAKRPLEIPVWTQVCDDFKVIWLGETVKAGSILGPRNRDGEDTDTSPQRQAPPDTSAPRPDASRMPPPQTSRLRQAIAQDNRQRTQEALGLPKPQTGAGSPFKNFTLRNLKIGSILAFARKVGLDDTADKLLVVLKRVVQLVSDKPCVLPESLTSDALQIELQQRGLSSQGDRNTLLQRYRQPDDCCPFLQVSLPRNVYCKIDQACLGVECCMNLKVFMISLAFKAFMRFDPCQFQFVMGLNSWNYTVEILQAEFGKEWEVPVPFHLPFLDDMELLLRYSIEKTQTQLLVSMSVAVCPETGDADCLATLPILTDSIVPLPICHPNGTFSWPDINLDEYFSRAALRKRIQDSGEELLEAGIEAAFSYVLEELGIPMALLGGKDFCPTPTRLTDGQLTAELSERGLTVDGTRVEKEDRLSQDDRACQYFSLPAFVPSVAEVAYCSLSPDCLRLDCCLQLDLPRFRFRRSFRARLELDPCQFTLTFSFQHLSYRTMLLAYNWGETHMKKKGAITLTYSVDKLDDTKEFRLDFGASVCGPDAEQEGCLFDLDIISDYRVPIPLCNTNFTFSLPGGNTLRDFVDQVGANAGEQAVRILLEYLGLEDKIDLGPCDLTQPASGDEDACTDLSLPPLPGTLTCDLAPRCLGIRCCAQLDLRIAQLSASLWMTLDPCNFTLSVGLGKWSAVYTLFDYHWGTQEQIRLGRAVTITYTVDKLAADKVFVLDLGLTVCVPDCEGAPSVDILRGTRVPIPLCNENATFSLPGDGTIRGFLEIVGQNAGNSTVDAVLQVLGLSNIIHRGPCDRPQVTQNGWQRICPRDIRLPHLPQSLVCSLPEECLGFDCCLQLPIPFLPSQRLSARLTFAFDPCDFRLTLGLGSWGRDLNVFAYQWGQRLEVTVGKAFTLSLAIDKLDEDKSFRLDLDVSFCLDSDDCLQMSVLHDTRVPIPFCHPNASFQLPGDGSLAGLARSLAGSVGELAVQAALRTLGIQQYVNSQQCDMDTLAPSENRCPLLGVPPPSGLLTCSVDDRCLGLRCCASLDLVVTRLTATAWATLDPCAFSLSVGLGTWTESVTLPESLWGVERTLDIGGAVYVAFTIDKLEDQKELLVDLSLTLCPDGVCTPIGLLQSAHVPIPICNPNASLSLPGNGTVAGFVAQLAGQVTDAAVDLLLDSLGLKNFLTRMPCNLPPTLQDDNDCPVQLPEALTQLSCHIDGRCTSLRCCLTLDLKLTSISSRAWLEIDPCAYTLSVGLERWYFNASLFSYQWGRTEAFTIGNVLDVSFSIDKLDATMEYEVDLAFTLWIDGMPTDFPLLSGRRLPIPLCHANASLALPGDGTVRGFLAELGESNVGQAAVQLLLRTLHLQDVISGTACEVSPEVASSRAECPEISLPFLEGVVQCSLDDGCLGVRCCAELDFVLATLSLGARIQLDPCNFWLYVALENWERNVTLFTYNWGREETISLGSAVTIRYSVDKLSEHDVFSVTLIIELCIDGDCVSAPVLDRVWFPIPLCNANASALALPGDGTVAGFVRTLGGHIGNSAIDLVLQKLGLDQYLRITPCDQGSPGTLRSSCAGVWQLPESLSCEVSPDSCLAVHCCLELDLKVVRRSVGAWAALDPCNFTLTVGSEQWQRSLTLFHYPLGEEREEEVIDNILTVRWRVAKLTADKQFEVDLSLVLCLDGECDTLTVLAGTRFPIPLCNTEDVFALPGDGTVAGFLSYLGGNVGQFAVDAALRHLRLQDFLTGKGCSHLERDICASSSSLAGNCSLVGETCTELRCCLDLDLRLAQLSATAWFRFDPCDFTFALGLETWSWHGSVFNYQWGEEMTVSIAPGVTLRYTITNNNATREVEVQLTLTYCIDDLCNDIDIYYAIPIPVCNPNFSNYTLSVEGFVETVSGQVIEGATLSLLTQLGIDPDFFSAGPCLDPGGTQTHTNCPGMRPALDLPPPARCAVLDTCFGVRCCLDVNLGPLNHSLGLSLALEPCAGRLSLQVGSWQYSKTLSQLDFHISQEVTIGNFISLSYMLELMDGEVSISLSSEVCVAGHCSGQMELLDSALSPLPFCYPNGTISWSSLPGTTTISQLGNLEVGSETVTRALGLPTGLVSATPCPPVLQPQQSGACPDLPRLPSPLSGGVCRYTDDCLGAECCLTADLGVASRTLRAWLVLDPCQFRLSVGFENWSYNLSLLSYKWGQSTRERLSDVVSLAFAVGRRVEDGRSGHSLLLLSLSVRLCLAGGCSPGIHLLDEVAVPIPLCLPDGTLEWASDSEEDDGGIGGYTHRLASSHLGISEDILLPQPCDGPPPQITPTTAVCGGLSLPSPVAGYCALDQTCLGVGCCLPFDLGILQWSLAVWATLDPCTLTFSLGLERWTYTEQLSIQTLQIHSQEKRIGAVRIRYEIDRPHSTVFDIDLDISVCLGEVCGDPMVLLQDAMVSGSHCDDASSGSSSRRKRRSVDDLAMESEEGMEEVEDIAMSSVDRARDFLKAYLASHHNGTLSAAENVAVKLQPDKVVPPRVATSGTASRRSMALLTFGDGDNGDGDQTLISRRRRRDLTVAVTSGGVSLFELDLGPGADSDAWQGNFLIGSGLTAKGLTALGRRIVNMTIGELEAMLDLQNLDPATIIQLMQDLRSLYRTFIEEFTEALTDGTAADKFSQFDIVLSGTIPFPRREVTFFRYSWGMPVGGIIWLEFTIKAGGFFDMKIPVAVHLVSMKAQGGITPMVGAYATARVSIGFILYGELELKADILHTSFPTTAEIRFSKFPLDVGLKLDIEMIPLIIRLKALVTLKIPFFGRKVLFKKEIWRYEARKIWGNIFDTHTKEPDKTPPEIDDYSTPKDGSRTPRDITRRSGGSCGVEQVEGLDYTEPAFQLEVAAADDKSLVTFAYQVGTVPGAGDVAARTEFGGPSAIISQTLLGGHPLHFTVFASNNGGGVSVATCRLPTLDLTLPTGRIAPAFTSTSHPHVLRASAVVYDDSLLLVQSEAVGFGAGVWGDQIIPWNPIDITQRQHLGTSDNDFHYFTAAKKGRLISKPTDTVTHRNPNFCARDCLALPETKCLSINYDYATFTCELLEEIEGHGVGVHESGHFTHYERLGVGHAVEFDHTSLALVHNNLYYFNVEMLNYVGYRNIISSLGVLADFTPPAPGLIANASREQLVQEPCAQFTPEEWERRCVEDTPLDNHRLITDGPGSMTVFNGFEELVDMKYTRSNTFLAANWDGIHDNETGIYGYTWAIGSAICLEDVSMHIDPHGHLFDESEWTHQGLITGANLPDGAYFIAVRALNKVEFGGPMALTVCHSNPLVIDNTHPIIHSMGDITYDSSIGRIGLTVHAEDPESHLMEFHLAAGSTPRDVSLRDWESHALADRLFMDFVIPDGVPCWMKVRAVNNVDLRTISHANQPILVDATPPVAGDLLDGPYAGRDLMFTKDRNQICANWHGWFDAQSGIFAYEWSVGSGPGLEDVVATTRLSSREHWACSGYVTLQHGQTYYTNLRAFHGGYDKLNVSASSNGVTLDMTPPLEGAVFDGARPAPEDLDYSAQPATVQAHWEGFSDPDSGIEDYEVTVYRKHDDGENATDEFEVLHAAESVGKGASSVDWHHFHLHHKDRVYVNLRTINRALDHIDTASNGFLLDLTPPMLAALGDGLEVGKDADFQSHTDSLAVHWDYFDEESGIESFELAIYEMRQGNKHKIFPQNTDANSFHAISDATTKSHVQTGLSLRTGSLYIVRIKAKNRAKLVASHETSGVKVDPTPPTMRYVRAGNLDGEAEEVVKGYVYQNSRTSMQASWRAVDSQSGIETYWVSVGTAPNAQDVRPFTSLGSEGDAVLSGLDLRLTNASTCSDEAFSPGCQPVYYVCVKSQNGAGAFSDVACSSPVRVVDEDQTGFVIDGPDIQRDVKDQKDRTTVTIQFDDFESQLHGISSYQWAVGTTPGGEDVQPLTSDGIEPGDDPDAQGLAGWGKAQSSLPLRQGVTYYSSLRATTNGNKGLESTSNGFTVDITSPQLTLTKLGQYSDAQLDLSQEGAVRLYQASMDSVDASWETEELESEVLTTVFSVGLYPGDDEVFPHTQTNASYVPASLVTPTAIGSPNVLTVTVFNTAGLRNTVHTTSLTVDNTVPTLGQVQCPEFVHADAALDCHWSDFLDAESSIDHFRLLVGTEPGHMDVYQSPDLPGYVSHHSARGLDLSHNAVYYVTVEASNGVNQSTWAFSAPVYVDDTPPTTGLVVELSSGLRSLPSAGDDADPEAAAPSCLDAEQCRGLDAQCLESLSELRVLWQPFADEETRISRYEVALGTTPGGAQIRPFRPVPAGRTWEVVTNVDLSRVREVYATVRGQNQAGLTSTATSDGVRVSRFSAGLPPLRPFSVRDGVRDADRPDMDYQTSLTELSAAWDFSGDPCPVTGYRWAIYRMDGLEVQPMTDVGERLSDTNTDIEMNDGESYYVLVQAVNALGVAITVRSDGITVRRDPLIPGHVYDGPLAGLDLTYQREADRISASWSGFGTGLPDQQTVQHSGNEEVAKAFTTEQTVDFYEAAVGTDRLYPKTRDNVVPFTNVGRNTTVTFTGLDLVRHGAPTYYVTVRAHSASFSKAEVTSTGVNIGVDSTVTATEVEIPEFVNSRTEVGLKWHGFRSEFPILLYHVGLGRPGPASLSPDQMDCLEMLLGSEHAQATFDQRPMQSVGKDTYVDVEGLNLTQAATYFVTVTGVNEGGQCNSSTSFFSVDVTPPVEGQLRVGPFYDMPVSYTDSAEWVSVVWRGYRDEESGLKAYRLRLLEAAACDQRLGGNLTLAPSQDWLELGPDTSNFTFVDLNLQTNQPYFIQLEAVNRAGDSTLSQLGPIFVDDSEPQPGLVVDGPDFKMDLTDSGNRQHVTGTILHLADPDGPLCLLRDIPFTDLSHWSALDFTGLWNMNREDWNLKYQPAQVSATEESLTLKLERDTRERRMLSGAYVTNALIVRSSEYQFDLIAASSAELHAVTSILFWDGPDGTVGEYDFGGSEDWLTGICQCCYTRPLNQSACPECDCLDFLGESYHQTTQEPSTRTVDGTGMPTADSTAGMGVTGPNTMTEESTPTATDGSAGTPTAHSATGRADEPDHWTVRQAGKDGNNVTEEQRGRWRKQRACGLQLYPNGNASQAILWCRFFEDKWSMKSEAVDLDFDPSLEQHRYTVHIRVMPFDAQEDEWSFEVYIDGKLLASLTGIPVLSMSTKLVLHVFNPNAYIADLRDIFHPPYVTATFRNMRLPASQSLLCRYGAPFRAGTSPVARYFAGVGSQAGAADVVPLQEVARPCVACLQPCDRFQCDPGCPMGAVPITFTLADLSLPRLVASLNHSDTNHSRLLASDEMLNESLPFFLTVKSVLGNGKWEVASSNGFYVDDTPAVLDVFFYLDANINQYQPVEFQSSASVISALWSFVDEESLVKENLWAIGTSRGATDLQGFVSVGSNQTAANRNLTGVLQHNQTYYITLKALNGAGLETVVECDGVTVLLEGPTSDDVNTTALFSQRFEEEVYPPDVERSEDPSRTGTSWTRPDDESINRYEYCVGSSSDPDDDDIIPCMVVGVNASGSVAVQDGLVVIRAGDREERYNVSDFRTQQEPGPGSTIAEGPASFNMEPGSGDSMGTSSTGEDISLTSASSQKRRRRSTDSDDFDVTVATHGGLHQGGSIVLGLLDQQKLEEEFTSDASVNYKPYIVNPGDTIQYTSRLLRQRITHVYKPLFYLTSLGQIELQGPLAVTARFHIPANWTEAKPGLIFWNTDQSEWHDAAKTCADDGDQILYEGDRVTVKVCATHGSSSTTFFSRETEFALCIILDTIPNSPPVITNLVQEMYMDEDQGTLEYTFQAADAEEDAVVFELVPAIGLQGTAAISQDGQFSFTPCPDCHGRISVQIIVRETATFAGIEPLSVTATIFINVRPVNDNPVLFMGLAGQVVGNGRTALITVEQNVETNVAYVDLQGTLGAYDVDPDDSPRIRYLPPLHGELTVKPALNGTPDAQSCGAPSGDDDVLRIPCGLKIPHDRGDMSWAVSTWTYTPQPGFYGRDSFLALAEDGAEAVSQLLEVLVFVLENPCTNQGTCQGPTKDPNCVAPERSLGFESYSCRCPPGWTGEVCELDFDECLSDPCIFPYVCRDQFNGYQCACPDSDPRCDRLPDRLIVILAVCCSLLVLLMVALASCIYLKRRGKKEPESSDDEDGQPISQPISQPTPQSVQAFDNPTFVEDIGHPSHPTGAGGVLDTDDVNVKDELEFAIQPYQPESSDDYGQPMTQPTPKSVQVFDNPTYVEDIGHPSHPTGTRGVVDTEVVEVEDVHESVM